jgi:ketosteroid isomerase-like protein
VSEENVERVRRAVDALNRGDFEAALDGVHPELEWRTLDVFPDATTYRGTGEVREFFETWRASFRGFHLRLESCEALGDDHVIAALRVGGEGAGSGVEVESPVFFQLLEYSEGQLIRSRMFQTEAEVREAALGIG